MTIGTKKKSGWKSAKVWGETGFGGLGPANGATKKNPPGCFCCVYPPRVFLICFVLGGCYPTQPPNFFCFQKPKVVVMGPASLEHWGGVSVGFRAMGKV